MHHTKPVAVFRGSQSIRLGARGSRGDEIDARHCPDLSWFLFFHQFFIEDNSNRSGQAARQSLSESVEEFLPGYKREIVEMLKMRLRLPGTLEAISI